MDSSCKALLNLGKRPFARGMHLVKSHLYQSLYRQVEGLKTFEFSFRVVLKIEKPIFNLEMQLHIFMTLELFSNKNSVLRLYFVGGSRSSWISI